MTRHYHAGTLGTDLITAMMASAHRNAQRIALVASGEQFTYGALMDRARRIGHTIHAAREARHTQTGPLGAVMGSRTPASFVGVLGTILSGAAYVPLNPAFPVKRTEQMLRAAGVESLVVEEHDLGGLSEMLNAF